MNLAEISKYFSTQLQMEVMLFFSCIFLGISLFLFRKFKPKYEEFIEKYWIRQSINLSKMFMLLLGESGADRIYLLEFDRDSGAVTKTNHDLIVNCLNETLRDEGITTASNKRSNLRIAKFDSFLDNLLTNKVVLINNTAIIDNIFVRAFFTTFNTNSACMALIYDLNDNSPIAVLCFDFVRRFVNFDTETRIVELLQINADKLSFVYKK